jgi:hypothetical protein
VDIFEINASVRFLTSSSCSCFEHRVFIIRKATCTCSFSCICVSSLAGGRVFSNTHFHLLDLKSVHLVGSPHFIVSQCTVQGTQNIKLQDAMTHGVWSSLILRNVWHLKTFSSTPSPVSSSVCTLPIACQFRRVSPGIAIKSLSLLFMWMCLISWIW